MIKKQVMFWLLSKQNTSEEKNHIIVQFKTSLTIKSCFPPGSVLTCGITYIENISIETVPSRAILTH